MDHHQHRRDPSAWLDLNIKLAANSRHKWRTALDHLKSNLETKMKMEAE